MFSTGVILFIIVQGIFPFKEAKKDEYFYNLILTGKLDQYWTKVGGQNLSKDFKDLILKMFSYDGTKRPSVEDLKAHPWMQKAIDIKKVRSNIMEKLTEIRSAKTADSSRESASSRGDPMLELVRDISMIGLERYKFNDQTDFDIECEPGVLWDELNSFNQDIFEGKLKIESNLEKQHFKIGLEDKDSIPLLVKVQFYDLADQNSEKKRLRVRFTKKRGDLVQWYEIFKQMQETQLEGLLLAPRVHQN
jgi:serine/threonine protein kinase